MKCLYRIKSSPEPASQFQSNLVQIILGSWKFYIVQIKGQVLFKRGDNYKNAKMGWGHLKISSRTTEPEELTFT
jgi:hypothetical protein